MNASNPFVSVLSDRLWVKADKRESAIGIISKIAFRCQSFHRKWRFMLFPGKKEQNFTAGFRPYGIVGAAGGFYNTGTADENRRRIWHHFWKIKNLWL